MTLQSDFNLLAEAGSHVENFNLNPHDADVASNLVVSASKMMQKVKLGHREFEEPALALSELLVTTGRVRPALEVARQIVLHIPAPNNGGSPLQRSATELLLQIGDHQSKEHPAVAIEAYGLALGAAEIDSLPHHKAALGLVRVALSTSVHGLDHVAGRYLGSSSAKGSPEQDMSHEMRKYIGPSFHERFGEKKSLLMGQMQAAYEDRIKPANEWGNAVKLFKSRILAPC